MPSGSKSPITTSVQTAPRPTRRLPQHRPPTHPGEMLLEEFIKPSGITQSELAIRLHVSFPRLNELVHGRRAVTPDTALRLARVVGMPADFWLGLQIDWDLWQALHGPKAEEIESLERAPQLVSRDLQAAI